MGIASRRMWRRGQRESLASFVWSCARPKRRSEEGGDDGQRAHKASELHWVELQNWGYLIIDQAIGGAVIGGLSITCNGWMN